MAEVFIPMSREARDEEPPGLRRPSGEVERCCWFGGRWETQSWTRRETLGLETRLRVFFEEGLVVIIMMGPEGRVGGDVVVVVVVDAEVEVEVEGKG